MSLPSMRLTVRSMMVVVAVLGIALGAEMMRRKVVLFRELSQRHERREWRANKDLEVATGKVKVEGMCGQFWLDLKDPSYYRSSVAYHAQMKRKYDRAALMPFLAVAPDPPPPPEPMSPLMQEMLRHHHMRVLEQGTESPYPERLTPSAKKIGTFDL